MPTFIDESGDTGHSRNSSPYFRLAAIWIPENGTANAFRESIRSLRHSLGLDPSFEFKFARTQSNPDRRQAFFDIAMNHEFRFAVCAIDKRNGHWSKASSNEQHWAAATAISSCLRPVYRQCEQSDKPLNDPIFVDDNGDRKFLAAVKTAFRGLKSELHPGFPMTAKPKFRGSKQDEVMQLVDMVCGAAGSSIDDDRYWYNLIESRCLGFIKVP